MESLCSQHGASEFLQVTKGYTHRFCFSDRNNMVQIGNMFMKTSICFLTIHSLSVTSIAIYRIKFNKFVFNKRYSLRYLGDYLDMKMEEKNGHWFLFVTFYSIFKAVVYL